MPVQVGSDAGRCGGLGRSRRQVVLDRVVLRLGDLRPREWVAGAVIDIDGGRGDPYVSWITATAGQADATGAQAKAAVAAYEAAFAMTVPPPAIAANRPC
jgi:hypothetical protein